MNIKDHPDFKINVSKRYCNECKKETEHKSCMRHTVEGEEDAPPEHCECSVCGHDQEYEEYLESRYPD